MDFCRSGYTGSMRFVAGDSSIVRHVSWYRCAPTALPFPGPHAFGSQNWDTDKGDFYPIGDANDLPRSYYNGRRINASDGRSFAGPANFFLDGAPAPGAIPRGVDGTPVQCMQPPFGIAKGGLSVPVVPSIGGKLLGGTVVSSGPIPGTPCGNCSGITPAFPVVTIAGATGAETGFNGAWTCTQISACTWGFTTPVGPILISRLFGGTWSVNVSDFFPGTTNAFYTQSTSDCVTPLSVPFAFGTRNGLPTSVALSFL